VTAERTIRRQSLFLDRRQPRDIQHHFAFGNVSGVNRCTVGADCYHCGRGWYCGQTAEILQIILEVSASEFEQARLSGRRHRRA
jgi:hypothetical protein